LNVPKKPVENLGEREIEMENKPRLKFLLNCRWWIVSSN